METAVRRAQSGLVLAAVFAGVGLTAGCGMITTGESPQRIPVTSVPMGARVIVNDVGYGETPLVLELTKRAKGRVIRIESSGYVPVEIRLTKKTTEATFFPNLFLGMLPAVVPATVYSLTHDGRGFLAIWVLSAAAFGAIFTAVDSASGAVSEFVPKEITVRLKKADGTPRVDTILVDAKDLQNIRWIRIRRD